MNVLYSTPSCYTYNVNKENATFEVKDDDFHPYGIEPGVYWTGYFTTRGGFKMHIKHAGHILQVSSTDGYHIQLLKKSLGILISGGII